MDEVQMVFDRFDANKDGKISSTELAEVLKALGSYVSDAEVNQMMHEIDTDGDGFINMDEFVKAFKPKAGSNTESLKDAFDTYDLNKDGLISSSELHSVLTRLGSNVSMQDCVDMIKSADSNQDGTVSFEEFKKLMGKQ